MIEIKGEIQHQIGRILGVCVELLGLQRTAAKVLAVLYMENNDSSKSLSLGKISKMTHLSQSTVWSLCSQLERLGILERQLDNSQYSRGRRKIFYSLRVGIDGLLKHGIIRNLGHVRQILDDIKIIKHELGNEDKESKMSISRVTQEICHFLEKTWQEIDMEICT